MNESNANAPKPANETSSHGLKWESSIDVRGAVEFLRGAKTAVLLTHAKPDGDAAGSTLAMTRSMQKVGIDATVWYVGPTPRWLREIAGTTKYEVVEPAGKPGAGRMPTGEPDVVVITDTGSWAQLSELQAWVKPRQAKTLVIDHHLHGDADVSTRKFLGLGEAATTQVLTPVCCGLLGCTPDKLPIEVAEPIYLGLATDTQWFKLSNVSPKTLRLAGDLLDAGVNHTKLYEIIEQRDAAARWLLLGRALSSLELHDNGRVALMRLTLKDFAECGSDRNDTSGFADMVLSIASVQVAAVVSEAEVAPGEPAVTKVSMRSKPGPDAVDVNKATMSLGGGGHARAAGAKMVGVTIGEGREKVLRALL